MQLIRCVFVFGPARTASRGSGVRGTSEVGGLSSDRLAVPGRGIFIYLFLFVLYLFY